MKELQKQEAEIITLDDQKIAKEFGFSAAQVAVAKRTVASSANLIELAYFLNVAKSQKLDPFNKEIWCYKDNRQNLIIFAGRDGMLRKAQENPKFNGMRSSEVCENDEFSLDIANNKIVHQIKSGKKKDRGVIIGAYAIVFRKEGEPTIAFCHLEDYKKKFVWDTHTADMIKKTAEHKALKKSFGFSGLQDEADFEIVNGVAIPKNYQSIKEKPEMKDSGIPQAIKHIKNGGTIEQIEQQYTLTDNQLKQLQDA